MPTAPASTCIRRGSLCRAPERKGRYTAVFSISRRSPQGRRAFRSLDCMYRQRGRVLVKIPEPRSSGDRRYPLELSDPLEIEMGEATYSFAACDGIRRHHRHPTQARHPCFRDRTESVSGIRRIHGSSLPSRPLDHSAREDLKHRRAEPSNSAETSQSERNCIPNPQRRIAAPASAWA